jgi:hypothetical protein
MSRELDRQCALALGWTDLQGHSDVPGTPPDYLQGRAPDGTWTNIPDYETEHEDAQLLEDEVERRGLWREYLWALVGRGNADYLDHLSWDVVWERVARATPEQKARAFLEVVSGE